MRDHHEQVWIWLKRKLAGLVDNVLINHNGQSKEFSYLPGGGFFIVNLIPPESWDDGGPIPLVFSFHNLYLLGFLHGAVWYVYKDAVLHGSGYSERQHKNFLKNLDFGGGYNGIMFENVEVGMPDLHNTYTILAHYKNQVDNHEQDVVEAAMYRLIIALPEAWRFPGWKSYLHEEAFATFTGILVDNPATGVKFSDLFQKWSKICNRILDGPLNYIAGKHIKGFPDYASLLPAVSVLLP